MKEQEAIELLKGMQHPLQDYADLVGAPSWAAGCRYVYPDPVDYAIEEAITALEEKQNMKWIPVEEQLPKEKDFVSDKVLIAQGVHDKQISFGWLRNGIWVTSDMVPFVRQELITHWMPLPDKPVN